MENPGRPWPGAGGIALLMLLLVVPPFSFFLSFLFGGRLHPAAQFGVLYLGAFGFASLYAWWRALVDDPHAWRRVLRVPAGAYFLGLPFMLIGFWVCLFGLLAALTRAVPVAAELLEKDRQLAERPFLAVALIVVAAPALEEFVFRGAILRGLAARMAPGPAIVLSAVLFAAIHGNVHQFLSAFALGLVAGWLCWRTGGLVAPILWHAIHNAAMLLAADGVAWLAGVAPDAMDRATVPMPAFTRLVLGVLLCGGALVYWARTLRSGSASPPTSD